MTAVSEAAPVVLDDAPLTVAQLVRVARGADLVLAPVAQARIAASREVVDSFVDGPEPIYGLNTGLGHMRDERVPRDVLAMYQVAIVGAHEGGFGEPLPVEVVRAAIATRVAGVARGGSGASPALAETLVAMLNAGVHPVVPTIGSVGASDLMHMAAIGLVVIGQGRARYADEVLPGADAMQRAGIPPATLEPKDGLSLISANGVAVGHSALVAERARVAARLADLAVSMSLEATRGNTSIVDPVVARAKPVAGQSESAARIRAFLAGSERCQPGAASSVQDALSFRVAPQVHGAFVESTEHLVAQVEIELAAMDDNPLVDVDGRRMLSNGNFHPLAMALAADALRPALAHVGQLSDRRLNHLWVVLAKAFDLSSTEAFESVETYSGALLRYAAAARYTELRQLAGPVTLDVAPLDLGTEDHATNAPLAARRSDEALVLLDELLVVELLAARQLVARDRAGLGAGTKAAVDRLDGVLSALPKGSPAADLHASVVASLPDVLAAAETATG